MRVPDVPLAEGDLRPQRQILVRGLSTINTLNFGGVILVAVLALVAVVLGLRAREDTEKLWAASVRRRGRAGSEARSAEGRMRKLPARGMLKRRIKMCSRMTRS